MSPFLDNLNLARYDWILELKLQILFSHLNLTPVATFSLGSSPAFSDTLTKDRSTYQKRPECRDRGQILFTLLFSYTLTMSFIFSSSSSSFFVLFVFYHSKRFFYTLYFPHALVFLFLLPFSPLFFLLSSLFCLSLFHISLFLQILVGRLQLCCIASDGSSKRYRDMWIWWCHINAWFGCELFIKKQTIITFRIWTQCACIQ